MYLKKVVEKIILNKNVSTGSKRKNPETIHAGICLKNIYTICRSHRIFINATLGFNTRLKMARFIALRKCSYFMYMAIDYESCLKNSWNLHRWKIGFFWSTIWIVYCFYCLCNRFILIPSSSLKKKPFNFFHHVKNCKGRFLT